MPSDKRARQRENREKLLAEQAKVERRAKMLRRGRILIVIAAIVAVFAWLTNRDSGSDTETSATSAATTQDVAPADYAGFRAQTTACGATAPPERVELSFEAAEDQGLSGMVEASLETSCGSVELMLDADASPETVNSFAFLAREGYFNGTACHRLVSGFVLQCGDPTATGLGGPGYTVPDEFPEEGYVYESGTIAMANAGAGTTGSQFFLVIGNASFLPPEFNVLGTFEDPNGVLDRLATVPLGQSGREVSGPLETIYLNSVSVRG